MLKAKNLKTEDLEKLSQKKVDGLMMDAMEELNDNLDSMFRVKFDKILEKMFPERTIFTSEPSEADGIVCEDDLDKIDAYLEWHEENKILDSIMIYDSSTEGSEDLDNVVILGAIGLKLDNGKVVINDIKSEPGYEDIIKKISESSEILSMLNENEYIKAYMHMTELVWWYSNKFE